jgi:CheY-like chemotaxis protein
MIFYTHPLQDILAKNPSVNFSDKELSQTEFQGLIDEGHIVVGNHNRVYPRFLTLIVRNKATQLFVKEIDLAYIAAGELKAMTGYDELDEAFIEGQVLQPDTLSLFSIQNDLIVELDRYEYTLVVGYANLAYQDPVANKKLTIVHLDDHRIFAKGMEMEIRDKYFQYSDWLHFPHSDNALAFINEKFSRNESINIIITDMNHLSLNGYEFAKAVRKLESDYNMFRTPIIVLSMYQEENPLVQAGLSENLFDRFFSKDTQLEIIRNYIKGLLLTSWD